ncbi:hypothetical protein RvY_12972 [Ramazzottius varieornatus]|uniref:RRM domain-containing protein n=1 Tax=Ramazzottius varieornatus TaxID=947166 RepID=A0A1D1VN91_RAMVA|nr:hypothetical protein RvY_12972 [Ramazzottius varieornatus]
MAGRQVYMHHEGGPHNVSSGMLRGGGLDPNGRTIRIRNLALDTSEDDLRRIFSQLGVVADLWVVIDKFENQLGLAYCEFRDVQAVHIAVSHLNGVSFKGTQIQIEPIPNNLWKDERMRIYRAIEDTRSGRDGAAETFEAQNTVNGSSSSNDISGDTLANLNSEQMFNLMHQMRLCIEADPVGVERSLLKNFSLSAAMLYALLMMKMVDPQEAFDILTQEEPPEVPSSISTVGTSVPTPVSVLQPPPVISSAPLPASAMPHDPRQARMAGSYGGAAHQPAPAPMMSPTRGHRPGPPTGHSSEQEPNQIEMERAGMLMQLIQMSDAQLAALAPDHRQAVLMLREQLARQM